MNLGYEDFARAGVFGVTIQPRSDFQVLCSIVTVSNAVTPVFELGLQEDCMRLKIKVRLPVVYAIHVVQQILDEHHGRSTRHSQVIVVCEKTTIIVLAVRANRITTTHCVGLCLPTKRLHKLVRNVAGVRTRMVHFLKTQENPIQRQISRDDDHIRKTRTVLGNYRFPQIWNVEPKDFAEEPVPGCEMEQQGNIERIFFPQEPLQMNDAQSPRTQLRKEIYLQGQDLPGLLADRYFHGQLLQVVSAPPAFRQCLLQ